MNSLFVQPAPALNWVADVWPADHPAVQVAYTRPPVKRTQKRVDAWLARYHEIGPAPILLEDAEEH